MRFAISLLLICSLIGCSLGSSFAERVDRASFEWFGWTVISRPQAVTFKEIHLGNSTWLGQNVVVEGSIVDIGKFLTYVVLDDNTAKMLVVLSDIDSIGLFGKNNRKRNLRIWGFVERGQKGLPVIQALAVSAIKSS